MMLLLLLVLLLVLLLLFLLLVLPQSFQVTHFSSYFADSANDMNTNAYKAAIHKVHERTIYETSNALSFYVRECGGGWACLESRHKDWRFYYLAITTRSELSKNIFKSEREKPGVFFFWDNCFSLYLREHFLKDLLPKIWGNI